jgi:hypothetical protein
VSSPASPVPHRSRSLRCGPRGEGQANPRSSDMNFLEQTRGARMRGLPMTILRPCETATTTCSNTAGTTSSQIPDPDGLDERWRVNTCAAIRRGKQDDAGAPQSDVSGTEDYGADGPSPVRSTPPATPRRLIARVLKASSEARVAYPAP